MAVADQMELAPFGWRAGSLPGVLLAAAGQMELAPFGWRVGSLPGVVMSRDFLDKESRKFLDRMSSSFLDACSGGIAGWLESVRLFVCGGLVYK